MAWIFRGRGVLVGCFASFEGNDLYIELWRNVANEKEKTDNGGGEGISIKERRRGGGVRKLKGKLGKNNFLLFYGLNKKDEYNIENEEEIEDTI